MRIINPNVEILEQLPGIEGIYKQIEQAGRTCYKSEDNITDDSGKKFVDRMIDSGHLSMLEHGTVYLTIPLFEWTDRQEFNDCIYSTNPYCKIVLEDEDFYHMIGNVHITTNYRVIIEHELLDDLKYLCEPTEYHAKRYTVKLTTNIGVTREANRHRQSIAEESTRYCNYSKDKFGNDITVALPVWITNADIRSKETNITNLIHIIDDIIDGNPISISDIGAYFATIEFCGIMYNHLLSCGWTPQQAREILPLATKSDVVYTKSEDEWKHFFDLRLLGTTGKPHPNMQHCAALIINEFYNNDIYIPNYEVYHYYASKLK